MTRWEYMVVVLPHDRTRDARVADEKVQHVYQLEAILNEWGAAGWEVVGFATPPRSGTGGVGDPRLVLKRPVATSVRQIASDGDVGPEELAQARYE